MIPKRYDHLVPKKCTDKFRSINITPADIDNKYQHVSFELNEATDKLMRKTDAISDPCFEVYLHIILTLQYKLR